MLFRSAVTTPQVPSEIWLRTRLAGLAATERDHAAAHLSRCEEVLTTGGDWRGLVGEVSLARAAVAMRDRDWTTAATAAQQAITVFEDYQLPWRRVTALQVSSRALTASGRLDEAGARSDDVEALLAAIGAPERWRTHQAGWPAGDGTPSTRSQRARSILEP